MPLAKYSYSGPVDHTVVPDVKNIAGKSVVITGGANGMGETCVRHFVKAGAFVTFADMNEARGKAVEAELNEGAEAGKPRAVFVKCDIRSWDDQIHMFDTAKAQSPSKSIDVVIANAGISRSSGDSLWRLDDPSGAPTKPDLNIVDVNLIGTMYSFKLAVHYFRQQPDTADRDRAFIMTGSLTAYIDSPGNWEYTATKYALLGLMKTVRRNSWEQGVRINYVAPCYIRSAIRTAEYEKWLVDRGVQFGEQEDVAGCMLRIACDTTINGRSFRIAPRVLVKEGFVDIDREDYRENVDADEYFVKNQATQLVIIEDQWRDDYTVRVFKE